MKKKKRIISYLFLFVMIFVNIGSVAKAAEQPDFPDDFGDYIDFIYDESDGSFVIIEDTTTQRNSTIKRTLLQLTISSGKATIVTSITGYSGITTKVGTKVELHKKNGLSYTVANKFTNSTNNYTGTYSNTATISSGQYRAYSEFNATSSSGTESIKKVTEYK